MICDYFKHKTNCTSEMTGRPSILGLYKYKFAFTLDDCSLEAGIMQMISIQQEYFCLIHLNIFNCIIHYTIIHFSVFENAFRSVFELELYLYLKMHQNLYLSWICICIENVIIFVFELKLYLYLNAPGRGRMIWQVLQF